MPKLSEPSMHKNPLTPFQLAQLAVELARNNNHSDPRLFFPKAQQLLISAEAYLTEGINAIVEHAKLPADLALLTTNMPSTFGWDELLPTLAPVVRKRSGRGSQAHTREEIAPFLRKNFRIRTGSHGEIGDKGKSLTEGDDLIHLLDSRRLSQPDAARIRRKWQYFRKKRTNKATEARKENAAKERRRVAAAAK